jgi:chromosomal replication initiator protein
LIALADLERRVARIERELEAAPLAMGDAQIGAVRRIVEDAARLTGLTYVSIVGRGRKAELSFARFAVIWVARKAHGYSFPRIARALGGRDHTSIIHGEARAIALRADDIDFFELSERLFARAMERSRRILSQLTDEGN